MKISIDNALGLHPQALALRAERTSLLAGNIAQADTPGFKARDIDFQAVLAEKMTGSRTQTKLLTTNSGHITRQEGSNGGHEVQYRVPLMPSLDGNTVDVQTEQSKFAENNMRFLASLRFVDGRFGGLIKAIKGE